MPSSAKLIELTVSNYKAFHGSATLLFRPITVVIGRNGAGKSAITRLPLAIAAALEGRGPPGLPPTVRGVYFGNSLLQLSAGGTAAPFTLSCVLEFGARKLRITCKIGRDPSSRLEQPAQWIEEWSLAEDDRTLWGASWNRTERRYEDSAGAVRASLAFAGILPVDPVEGVPAEVQALAGCLNVRHLLAVRGVGDAPFVSAAPSALLDCGTHGMATRAVLGSQHSAGRQEFLTTVAANSEKCLGIELDVREIADGPVRGTVVLARPRGRETWADVSHVGSGLEHALPVVVQHAAVKCATETDESVSLLTTEEPEAHLHPRAQAELADIVIEASSKTSCLVETHSETFILRLRRRVAEQTTLRDHQVAIYWVDDEGGQTELRPSEMTASGELTGFPEGWFDAALDEVRAIVQGTAV